MFSYPLECFVCRDVIENTFFGENKKELHNHILITISLSILTICLSFLTDCLGVVLEINVNTFIILNFLAFSNWDKKISIINRFQFFSNY